MNNFFGRHLGAFCVISVIVSFSISSCYYDKSELLYPVSTVDCSTVSAKFSTDVNPIIQSKCATSGCHDGNTVSALLNYAEISSKTNSINSRALVEKSMPPSGALNVDEISKIQCWISSGAPNN